VYLHGLIEYGKIAIGVKFLDLGPFEGEITQGVAMECDLPINGIYELSMKGVAVAKDQNILRCGRCLCCEPQGGCLHEEQHCDS
jgi:hypothetical protein